jgi:hypothetical protein
MVNGVAWGQGRTARAVRAGETITVDGVLDEAAWKRADWNSGFTRIEPALDQPQAAPQTRFKVVYTDAAAYVAVECDEPNVDTIKAKTPWRDGAVWSDDCVEVFFDPADNGRYYHQVMTNSRGTIYDSHSADFGLVHSKLCAGAWRSRYPLAP